MQTTLTKTRKATILRFLAVCTAVFALAACMNADQQTAFDLVNQSRATHGRKALVEDSSATKKAQAWAEHLAAKGSLSHSNLASGIDPGWKSLGENVGYGSSITSVHQSYMNSPPHRANILSTKFTHMGTGVAKGGGRVYTVIVFVQR